MKQAMREHFRSCGQVEAFLCTYAALSSGGTEPVADAVLWKYCDTCSPRWYGSVGSSSSDTELSCPDQCKLGPLFMAGWKEGQLQARQAFETGDLTIFEDIGRTAGKTSRRPPRNTKGHTAERDGVDGKLAGEALRHFVQCWRQTGRRYEGV
jgi:hypothetical protein